MSLKTKAIYVLLVVIVVLGAFNIYRAMHKPAETNETSDSFVFSCTTGETATIRYSNEYADAELKISNNTYLLKHDRSASGARYTSTDGTEFWEHQGEAAITIPGRADTLICTL